MSLSENPGWYSVAVLGRNWNLGPKGVGKMSEKKGGRGRTHIPICHPTVTVKDRELSEVALCVTDATVQGEGGPENYPATTDGCRGVEPL